MGTTTNRNIGLDLMRFLGVLVIMIAHSLPPDWLFQLRNFGTPLLIVASALTYAYIYRNKELDPIPFFKKRLSRLIFPAWIFLIFFFAFNLVVSTLLNRIYPFNLSMVVNSFTFYSGIGFVWIFKVYIVLALITPLALRINNRISDKSRYFIYLIIAYVVYELILYLAAPLIPPFYADFFKRVIFVIFPYSILFLYGLKLGTLTNRQIWVSSIFFLLISVGIALYLKYDTGSFVTTQNYKYPPQLYYLSYSLFALNLIYLFCRRESNKINPKIIIWLSSKSLWIYLWHIFAFFVLDALLSSEKRLSLSIIRFVLLFGFGILATYIQSLLVNKYLMNSKFTYIQSIGKLLL